MLPHIAITSQPYTPRASSCSVFFFNDTATTEIYTLSLHDALPISNRQTRDTPGVGSASRAHSRSRPSSFTDRKSTRLNSSHSQISYAVFCLKKKKNQHEMLTGAENI